MTSPALFFFFLQEMLLPFWQQMEHLEVSCRRITSQVVFIHDGRLTSLTAFFQNRKYFLDYGFSIKSKRKRVSTTALIGRLDLFSSARWVFLFYLFTEVFFPYPPPPPSGNKGVLVKMALLVPKTPCTPREVVRFRRPFVFSALHPRRIGRRPLSLSTEDGALVE